MANNVNGKKKRNVRGKKWNGKRDFRDARDIKDDAIVSTDNDWQWYAVNEQLLKDTSSYAFNYALGDRLSMGDRASGLINSSSIPGIMTIHTSAAVGNAQSINSPINIAARQIYSQIRNANSGAKNYDAVDLMLYLLAISECYSCLSWLQRIYGTTNLASFTNRYFPMAITYSQGADYQDILSHLADYRAYVNIFAQKLSALAVPATLPYFARHIWMYRGYYADTPVNDKAQMYLYVPTAFYQYQLDTEQAGMLKYLPLSKQVQVNSAVITPNSERRGLSLNELISYANSLLDPLLSSEDCALISGDILKAYTAANCLQPDKISETYTVLPQYSEDVLDQINNATLLGRRVAPSFNFSHTGHAQNDIYQDATKAYLKSDFASYYFYSDGWTDDYNDYANIEAALRTTFDNVMAANQFVNFRHGDVTPANVMVASRLLNTSGHYVNALPDQSVTDDARNVAYGSTISDTVVFLRGDTQTLGSDVAEYAKLWYFAYPNRGATKVWSLIASEDIYSVMLATLDTVNNMLPIAGLKYADDFRRNAMITMFDRHPRFSAVSASFFVNGDNKQFAAAESGLPMDDINYYTIVDQNDLEMMASAALLSEFRIDSLGSRVM